MADGIFLKLLNPPTGPVPEGDEGLIVVVQTDGVATFYYPKEDRSGYTPGPTPEFIQARAEAAADAAVSGLVIPTQADINDQVNQAVSDLDIPDDTRIDSRATAVAEGLIENLPAILGEFEVNALAGAVADQKVAAVQAAIPTTEVIDQRAVAIVDQAFPQDQRDIFAGFEPQGESLYWNGILLGDPLPRITVEWPTADAIEPVQAGTTIAAIQAAFVAATEAYFNTQKVTVTASIGINGSDPVAIGDVIDSVLITATAPGAATAKKTVLLNLTVVAPRPILPDILDRDIYVGADPEEIEVGVSAQNIADAVWSVTGPGISVTQEGLVYLSTDEAFDATDVSVIATAPSGLSATATFKLTGLPAIPAITITQQPTTAGLEAVTTATTVDDILDTLWTGQPVAEDPDGNALTPNHQVFVADKPMARGTTMLAGQATILTTWAVPYGEETLDADVTTDPFTVASATGLATISGTGPVPATTVLAGTPAGYQGTLTTPGTYTVTDVEGTVLAVETTREALRAVVDDAIIPAATEFSYLLPRGGKIAFDATMTAQGAETTTIRGIERDITDATIYVREDKQASVSGIVAGMSKADVIAKVVRGEAATDNGRPVEFTVDAVSSGADLATNLTAAGDTLTISVARNAIGAATDTITILAPKPNNTVIRTEANPTVFTVTVAAAQPGTELPATGLTLAQLESLRTDGTTRGVQPSTALKNGATATLPAGMSRSGDTITVAEGADIASLDAWDFTGFKWVIKGRIRSWTRSTVRYDKDISTGVIDLYPTARIDLMDWCSFLGPGYSGKGFGTNLFFVRTSGSAGPRVDLIDRCDFFGWGGDVIKSTWPGVIRRCYFDTAINLPAGTAVWSASTNYAMGAIVVSADKRYAYRSLTGGSGKALPTGKASNANWQNYDPHSDTLNPFYQFGPGKLLIESSYINRLEATRAVDPGSIRSVGINNGIRAIRNSGTTAPFGAVEIANVVISKAGGTNAGYPVQLADVSVANTVAAILRDSWIGSNSGGGVVHPGTAAGHTITNITEYANPTTPSAGYREIGTPSSGGGTGGTPDPDPDPTPAPVVIDPSTTAIVLTYAQSEPAFVTSMTYQSGTPKVEPTEPVLRMIWSDGSKANVGPVQNKVISSATKNQVAQAMIHLNNALAYIVRAAGAPGKQFCLGAANEEGTGRIPFGSATGDRQFINTKKIVDEIEATYGRPPDRACEYWYASDRNILQAFRKEFSPLYWGQWRDGRKFNLGAVNTDGYRDETVDDCLWDYETSDPSQKGRGLLPRTVPLDLLRKDTWADRADRIAEMQAFVDDPRFQGLGGFYGFAPYKWIRGGVTGSDGSHPDMKNPDGHVQAAYEFYMPSLLLAAGFPIKEPKFVGAYTAADGSYADVEFDPANGGRLSTDRLVRGGDVDLNATYAQEIWGFLIKRASGGEYVRVARRGASGIPTKYQGAVTRRSSTKARISMVEPIQPGDTIIYQIGYFAQDSSVSGTDQLGHNARYYRCMAIEHIPEWSDPAAVYPFAGFNVKTHGPEFVLQRGAYVGEQPSAPPTAPTAPEPDPDPTSNPAGSFTVGSGGPGFKAASGLLANTYQIDQFARIRMPVGYEGRGILFGQEFGCDYYISGKSAFGVARMEVKRVVDSNGKLISPSEGAFFTDIAVDQWIDIHMTTSLVTNLITHRATGVANSTKTLLSNSGFFTNRIPTFLYDGSSFTSAPVAGLEVEYLRMTATGGFGTVEVLNVAGDAATVNALTTKRGDNAV